MPTLAGMSTGHPPSPLALRRTSHAVLLVGLLLARSVAASQPPPAPDADAAARTHVDAFFTALASGDPQTFESMTRTHCTPGFLERRPAEQRAEMVRRLKADFGTMTLVRARAT